MRAPWFALARDLPALARAARRRVASRGTTLLSPFDSLLWHRERVRRLFGFDYQIEIYVPAPRRVHGYYVLPLMHDGRLIGRADLRRDRTGGALEARLVRFEPWFAAGDPSPLDRWGGVDRDEALAGAADALKSLAAFGDTPHVALGRVAPGKLRAPLARALRDAGD
jgi:hypothetical protein